MNNTIFIYTSFANQQTAFDHFIKLTDCSGEVIALDKDYYKANINRLINMFGGCGDKQQITITA